jgi:hypothetical protein
MKTKLYSLLILAILVVACQQSPKVITAASNTSEMQSESGIFKKNEDTKIDFNKTLPENFHTIKVNEILPTEKYVYLNVNEGSDNYWVAVRSMDVKIGETYYFKDGLLKTNYESKEHQKVFERVYLVSNLVAAKNHGNQTSITQYTEVKNNTKQDIEMHTENVKHQEGITKISELVANPKSFEGKIIIISGTCTKVNPNIMYRNWIHVKDGSQDDYDLVITSDTFIPEGKSFTMKAKVVLNKDFGAGYIYDLILEQGELVN